MDWCILFSLQLEESSSLEGTSDGSKHLDYDRRSPCSGDDLALPFMDQSKDRRTYSLWTLLDCRLDPYGVVGLTGLGGVVGC